MTRRSFITDMLKFGIATTFLPGAGRIWKPAYKPIRFFVPEPKRLDLNAMMANLYELAKARTRLGLERNMIEFYAPSGTLDLPDVAVSIDEHSPTIKGIYEQMRGL